MGKLYFVRHGESEWNTIGRICGATDIPLTDRGREMAKETAVRIIEEGIKIDKKSLIAPCCWKCIPKYI